MPTADDRIATVEATTVTLPIPRPLRLGSSTITQRRYAVVRVSTTDGLRGEAFALSRDTPVAATVRELLAPMLVGRPADAIAATGDALFRGALAGGRVGTFMRALSLVDIALWDIKGKRAGLPVWRLLGGGEPEVGCMLVAGYPTGEPSEELGEHVAACAREGHRLLKVARAASPDDTRRLLATAAEGFDDETAVVVDAGWWWRTAREAAAELRTWADAAPLAWVEDPLVPEDTDGYATLCAEQVAPIGVGDELTDRHAARRLLGARLAVLRIDAMAIGGITGARHVAALAEGAGVPVSYHVYPELHVHLAAGLPGGGLVETFGAADNPFDPAARLLTGGPRFEPSRAIASEAPGLGIELDDDLVRRCGDVAFA